MKRLGSLLILLGATVGIFAAAGIGGVFHLAFPWLVNLALAKLTLVASVGLMAAGAVVHRIAVRGESASIAAPDEARPALTRGGDDQD